MSEQALALGAPSEQVQADRQVASVQAGGVVSRFPNGHRVGFRPEPARAPCRASRKKASHLKSTIKGEIERCRAIPCRNQIPRRFPVPRPFPSIFPLHSITQKSLTCPMFASTVTSSEGKFSHCFRLTEPPLKLGINPEN